MTRLVGSIVIAAALLGAGFYAHVWWSAPPPTEGSAAPVTHRRASQGPTIEQVQKLASLVTLRVPISDVQISELEGFFGSVKLVMAVHGEVEIATALSAARFEDLDHETRAATLLLPRPAPQRPRLDHEKTRILELQRGGAWRFLTGDAGEKQLTNRAMLAAQRTLAEVAARPELVDQSCQQTETVVHNFFAAMEWNVTVEWTETATATTPEPEPEAAH